MQFLLIIYRNQSLCAPDMCFINNLFLSNQGKTFVSTYSYSSTFISDMKLISS